MMFLVSVELQNRIEEFCIKNSELVLGEYKQSLMSAASRFAAVAPANFAELSWVDRTKLVVTFHSTVDTVGIAVWKKRHDLEAEYKDILDFINTINDIEIANLVFLLLSGSESSNIQTQICKKLTELENLQC